MRFQILLFVILCASVCHGQTLEDRFRRALDESLQPEVVPEETTEDGKDKQHGGLTPSRSPDVSIDLQHVPQPALLRGEIEQTERWLVSELWCHNCPAAKRRFLANGGRPDHVISIADALQLHGKVIGSVPAEYSTTTKVAWVQPPTYRKQWPPIWDVLGDDLPTKTTYLDHLRHHANHAGKHWQAWSLESWSREQLAALHDDDHVGRVPDYSEPTMTATVTGERGGVSPPSLLLSALSWHLLQEATADPDSTYQTTEPVFSSLISINADVPDRGLDFARNILIRQQVEFPDAGVSLDWSGNTRTVTIANGRIDVKPGIGMKVQKFGLSKSCSLDAVTYTADLSSVTFELTGMLDLTVNLQ